MMKPRYSLWFGVLAVLALPAWLQAQPTPPLTVSAQLYQSFWQKVGIETEIRSIQGGPSYINPVLRGDYQIEVPAQQRPKEPPRRRARGERKYKHLDLGDD